MLVMLKFYCLPFSLCQRPKMLGVPLNYGGCTLLSNNATDISAAGSKLFTFLCLKRIINEGVQRTLYTVPWLFGFSVESVRLHR